MAGVFLRSHLPLRRSSRSTDRRCRSSSGPSRPWRTCPICPMWPGWNWPCARPTTPRRGAARPGGPRRPCTRDARGDPLTSLPPCGSSVPDTPSTGSGPRTAIRPRRGPGPDLRRLSLRGPGSIRSSILSARKTATLVARLMEGQPLGQAAAIRWRYRLGAVAAPFSPPPQCHHGAMPMIPVQPLSTASATSSTTSPARSSPLCPTGLRRGALHVFLARRPDQGRRRISASSADSEPMRRIWPRQMEASATMSLNWASGTSLVVLGGTGRSFSCPADRLGLFTRLAALGMIGFIVIQSLTDI